ncbi:hypothetical protein [Telluribacter sp. SYSU D00476]|uniref:hypothetical protein n=1 Tax=Telluribacter sp. SYSU D00476 TaxID=2811430 RepID=UPI001FF2C1D9|nr:hypothetical protein [Telluribacter sp. SYSU D00476]
MKKCILLLYLYSLSALSYAQDKEAQFYKDQLAEYNHWLSDTQLSAYLKIDSLSHQQKGDTLVLTLVSNYLTLDSLSTAWNATNNFLLSDRRISLAEVLHQQGAFLFDLSPQHLRFEILGAYQVPLGQIVYTERARMLKNVTMSGKPIVIAVQELRLPSAYKRITLSGKQLVKAVTQTLAQELKQYYSSKPSSWFYSVKVDTTRTFYNSLIYRVTCLKNEIINEDYFEAIELAVDVAQQANNSVEVRLAVRGKYCGGLLCPEQRDKFYYSMDGKYDGHVNAYAGLMEKRIEQWLSQ